MPADYEDMWGRVVEMFSGVPDPAKTSMELYEDGQHLIWAFPFVIALEGVVSGCTVRQISKALLREYKILVEPSSRDPLFISTLLDFSEGNFAAYLEVDQEVWQNIFQVRSQIFSGIHRCLQDLISVIHHNNVVHIALMVPGALGNFYMLEDDRADLFIRQFLVGLDEDGCKAGWW